MDKLLDLALQRLPGWSLLLLVLLLTLITLGVWRHADEGEILGGLFKFRRNRRVRGVVRRLQEEVATLGAVLPLFKSLHGQLADLLAIIPVRPETAASRLATLYHAALAGASQVVHSPGHHRAAILFPDPDVGIQGEWRLRLTWTFHYSSAAQAALAFGADSIPGRVYQTGELYYCRDTARDRLFQPNRHSTHSYRSFVCIPIRDCTGILGVLLVDAVQPDAFLGADLQALQALGHLVAALKGIESLLCHAAGDFPGDQITFEPIAGIFRHCNQSYHGRCGREETDDTSDNPARRGLALDASGRPLSGSASGAAFSSAPGRKDPAAERPAHGSNRPSEPRVG